jgi:hypothetical protein
MRILATPVALVLALSLVTPAAAQTASSQTITTSTVSTKVFNNGILQGNCAATPLFNFMGTEGGCGAGFLLGISSSNVIGDAYLLDANTGWTPGTIGASTVFPYPTLTSGVETTFSNATNGVSVVANHYTGTANPDFVVHHYVVTNTGGAPLANVFAGMFWDWDVGGAAAASNTAAYDAVNHLIYVNNPAAPTQPFFGTAALEGTVSGYRYDMPYPTGTPATHQRSDLYTGLTVMQGATSAPRDQRGVMGVGPYTIPAGESITVVFASLGGTNAADIIANAAEAQVATIPTAGEGSPAASALRLDPTRPSPIEHSASVVFSLAAARQVTLEVYDSLGRRVAVLVDGLLSEGNHPLIWDASSLPNGTYLLRLSAGSEYVTRSVAIAR